MNWFDFYRIMAGPQTDEEEVAYGLPAAAAPTTAMPFGQPIGQPFGGVFSSPFGGWASFLPSTPFPDEDKFGGLTTDKDGMVLDLPDMTTTDKDGMVLDMPDMTTTDRDGMVLDLPDMTTTDLGGMVPELPDMTVTDRDGMVSRDIFKDIFGEDIDTTVAKSQIIRYPSPDDKESLIQQFLARRRKFGAGGPTKGDFTEWIAKKQGFGNYLDDQQNDLYKQEILSGQPFWTYRGLRSEPISTSDDPAVFDDDPLKEYGKYYTPNPHYAAHFARNFNPGYYPTKQDWGQGFAKKFIQALYDPGVVAWGGDRAQSSWQAVMDALAQGTEAGSPINQQLQKAVEQLSNSSLRFNPENVPDIFLNGMDRTKFLVPGDPTNMRSEYNGDRQTASLWRALGYDTVAYKTDKGGGSPEIMDLTDRTPPQQLLDTWSRVYEYLEKQYPNIANKLPPAKIIASGTPSQSELNQYNQNYTIGPDGEIPAAYAGFVDELTQNFGPSTVKIISPSSTQQINQGNIQVQFNVTLPDGTEILLAPYDRTFTKFSGKYKNPAGDTQTLAYVANPLFLEDIVDKYNTKENKTPLNPVPSIPPEPAIADSYTFIPKNSNMTGEGKWVGSNGTEYLIHKIFSNQYDVTKNFPTGSKILESGSTFDEAKNIIMDSMYHDSKTSEYYEEGTKALQEATYAPTTSATQKKYEWYDQDIGHFTLTKSSNNTFLATHEDTNGIAHNLGTYEDKKTAMQNIVIEAGKAALKNKPKNAPVNVVLNSPDTSTSSLPISEIKWQPVSSKIAPNVSDLVYETTAINGTPVYKDPVSNILHMYHDSGHYAEITEMSGPAGKYYLAKVYSPEGTVIQTYNDFSKNKVLNRAELLVNKAANPVVDTFNPEDDLTPEEKANLASKQNKVKDNDDFSFDFLGGLFGDAAETINNAPKLKAIDQEDLPYLDPANIVEPVVEQPPTPPTPKFPDVPAPDKSTFLHKEVKIAKHGDGWLLHHADGRAMAVKKLSSGEWEVELYGNNKQFMDVKYYKSPQEALFNAWKYFVENQKI